VGVPGDRVFASGAAGAGSMFSAFDNGKYYLSMSGAEIFLPSRTEDRPDGDLLEWHRDTVFRG
jgi:hypothetical protein